jgi:8-hydroxy-5-deazaflavin:NADPH oxidoreductase
MKITIIGKGNVGSALQRGLERGGHDVQAVGNEPARIRDAAQAAEVLLLAVPFGALEDVLRTLGGAADGKVLLDVTNVLTSEFQLAIGFTTSGAEELQKKAPSAKVVKAFNTVFAEHMDSGRVKGEQLTALVASDDAEAKATVMQLARSIGFDAVDAGPLQNARLLEPMGYQNIQLGYTLGMGTNIGFRLVH